MRLRGAHLLKSLFNGGNIVVKIGPVVVKRVGGADARRKFSSELVARQMLAGVGIETVRVRAGTGGVHVLVMERAAKPTLDHELNASNLRAFEAHVIEMAERGIGPDAPAGYYWVDARRHVQSHRSFADFLLRDFAESEPLFTAAFPAFDRNAIRAILASPPEPRIRIVVPTDVAPKNVVFLNGEFAHLDLETVVVGPPEFLLVKAAYNLASDLGDLHDCRAVRHRLLQCCENAERARASLAFALVRRMVYESRAKRTDKRAGAALTALLHAASLEDVVTHLEGTWNAHQGASAFNSPAGTPASPASRETPGAGR